MPNVNSDTSGSLEVTPPFFACELSLQAGEQLFGTATRVDIWVLLEYRGGYDSDAVTHADIPQDVKDHLNGQLNNIPNSRLQLIKKGRQTEGSYAFFVVVATENDQRLYRFWLPHYEHALEYDLQAIITGDPRYESFRASDHVHLICTNGKRDKCCAKFGVEIYQEMAAYKGDDVWQTSHLGGHRFAGTGVSLPYGLFYGRIPVGAGPEIIDEALHGRIHLQTYRGRACYDEPVQAADFYLRRESGITEVDHFRLVSFEQGYESQGNLTHRVIFQSVPNNTQHLILLEERSSDVPMYKNSDKVQPEHLPQFYLTDYQIVG